MEKTRNRRCTNDVRYWIFGRVGVSEPSRRSRARLRGRFRTVNPRWGGNGPGPAHENDSGGQQVFGYIHGIDTRQRNQYGQGGQRVTDRWQFQFRSQRNGRHCEY